MGGPSVGASCAPAGRWVDPRTGYAVAVPDVLDRIAAARIVLLGEDHDRAEQHRWQAIVAAAIAGRTPRVILGFEMFPRRVQPALDRWVAGNVDEAALLAESDWRRVWGFDADLYRPLFELARTLRIPMRALNVERTLVRRVADGGWAGVPEGEREGVATPAAASAAYRTRLEEAWRAHQPSGHPADEAALDRFVEAQLVWDAAMATAIHAALAEHPGAVLVGIVGRGHVEHGDGIPAQLAALGAPPPVVLVPWERDRSCAELVPDVADLVFGLTRDTPATGHPDPGAR